MAVTASQAQLILQFASMLNLPMPYTPTLYSCIGGPLDGSAAPKQPDGDWPETLYVPIGRHYAVYRLAAPDAKTYLFRWYSQHGFPGGRNEDGICTCGCVRVMTKRGPVCCDPKCEER